LIIGAGTVGSTLTDPFTVAELVLDMMSLLSVVWLYCMQLVSKMAQEAIHITMVTWKRARVCGCGCGKFEYTTAAERGFMLAAGQLGHARLLSLACIESRASVTCASADRLTEFSRGFLGNFVYLCDGRTYTGNT
jgi:hypothetical protein